MDKTVHGTHHDRRGEKSPRAKLTVARILEAVALSATGASRVTIAAQFGVHPSAISRALRGKRWAHLQLTQNSGT